MKVKSVKIRYYEGPVHDLTIKHVHAYYANGIRIHNCHCRLAFDRQELLARVRSGQFFELFDGTGAVRLDAQGGQA